MKPLTIGVAGGSGSGKSTVVARLVEAVSQENVALLPHDAYYREYAHLTIEERRRTNWDHPNALETELLVEQLKQLVAGTPIPRPVYDFASYTRLPECITIEPLPIIIVDGILILSEPALRDLLDIKVYVDTDPDIRLIRRLQRDLLERGRQLSSVIEQYINTVRPMHLDFVEPSKRYADLIIPEGGFNRVAIEMLVARVQASIG